jgi:hypothetical protein
MAQTGFTPIQLYSSSTPTNAPSAGNLTNDTKGSELAVNIADGKLFYKDTSNNVQTIADKTWVGTVTSVSGTSPVAVATGTSTPVVSLSAGYGDTQNPYASKTANNFLAAPNGSSGAPTFRAIVAADIPTLNQNTTGSAATLTTARNLWGQSFNGSADISAPLYPAAGSVSAPAYSVTGNTNTGIFFPAADTIAFAEGGVESLRINSNGTVGIGTTSTSALLSLNRASGAADLRMLVGNTLYANMYASSSDVNLFSITSIPLILGTNNTERARIHASGGVSIGNTTDPGASNLSVTGAVAATIAFRETNGASGNIANGATFTITIPSVRRPQLLTLYSDYNLFQGWYGLIKGDGAGNAQTNAIVNNGGMTVAGTAASTITVTNNFGGTANIRWSLLPLGVAL